MDIIFTPLLILSAVLVGITHGGNDVGNAVGPLMAVDFIYTNGKLSAAYDIPFWALAFGGISFAFGILLAGKSTTITIGEKITN